MSHSHVGTPAVGVDQPRRRLIARFRDLPLFWKLLLPYLALMLIVALVGTAVVVRDLTSRAQTTLDGQLSRAFVDARSTIHERELYLLESANFAANLRGIADNVRRADDTATSKLLDSVLALKTDLNLLVATDKSGVGVSEFTRLPDLARGVGTRWSGYAGVRAALVSSTGNPSEDIFRLPDGTSLFVVVAPICSKARGCHPVGVALTGLDTGPVARASSGSKADVTLFDPSGGVLGGAGSAPQPPTTLPSAGQLVRTRHRVGGVSRETLFGPLQLQGRQVGTLAVTVPTGPAFAAVRGAAERLALIVLAALVGIVAIGALLSRLILAQVRPLVATNRRLGAGDLDARSPVLGRDELGELATGVNTMADQLQASITTLESRVDQRTEEVRRLLAERTTYFASLSHEFRTPLAVIRAQADLLADPGHGPAATAESLGVVKDCATEALQLIDDLLEVSRLEAGNIELNVERVQLPQLLRLLTPTIQGLASAAELTLGIDVPKSLPDVVADPRRLREVLLNLADNAVKYTPSGGRVDIAARAKGGNVVVTVTDTGVGISADAQGHVFEPFYRAPGGWTQHGQASSGLGLALTKQLVEAHGGTVSFTSVSGQGTTFTVTLPGEKPERARTVRRKSATARVGGSS